MRELDRVVRPIMTIVDVGRRGLKVREVIRERNEDTAR
jgi:hypothetical protein